MAGHDCVRSPFLRFVDTWRTRGRLCERFSSGLCTTSPHRGCSTPSHMVVALSLSLDRLLGLAQQPVRTFNPGSVCIRRHNQFGDDYHAVCSGTCSDFGLCTIQVMSRLTKPAHKTLDAEAVVLLGFQGCGGSPAHSFEWLRFNSSLTARPQPTCNVHPSTGNHQS